MRTIWKYTLQIGGRQIISVPRRYSEEISATLLWSNPVHVSVQDNQPVLWFDVDTDYPRVDVEILLIGTGQETPQDSEWKYVGTSVCDPFVWHIYARVIE